MVSENIRIAIMFILLSLTVNGKRMCAYLGMCVSESVYTLSVYAVCVSEYLRCSERDG